MIMTLLGALSAGTKTYLPCRSDRQAFNLPSAFCNTLPVECLKICFGLETHSSIWLFAISFQDDRTESSTTSRLAHGNVYCSTASHKSAKFLSQSTFHGSLYFHPRQPSKPEMKFNLSLVYKPMHFVWEEIFLNRQCNLKPLDHRYRLKATFHFSMRGQRAKGKIQRNNYHHGSCRPFLTGKNVVGVFDLQARDASECQKSLSEK